jgi:DHA2 family multidrug resistance protein
LVLPPSTTFLNESTDLHLARLCDAITSARQRVFETGSSAELVALKQLNMLIHRQGVVMAFADEFSLTLLFVGLSMLALLVRRPAQALISMASG